jgi:hypothetical protein
VPAPTILEAMTDERLFASHFASATWARWKVFIKAVFGLGGSMTADEVAVFCHHTGRTQPPTQPFGEAALVCGRRGGKSRILAVIAVYLAVFRDYGRYLAAGETPVIAIIAADRKQARVILRYIKGLMQSVPLLAGQIANELVESLELTNGIVI